MKVKAPLTFVLIFLISMILISNFSSPNMAQQQIPCEPPPGQGLSTVWPASATVNLYLDSAFGTTAQDIIATQISAWNTSTGLNVTFAVKTNAQDMGPGAAQGGNRTWFIFKQNPPNLGAGAQGETSGFSFQGRRGDTTTSINPGVTTALAQVASHEVGHTFGLADCTGCTQNSSALTLPSSSSLNALGGHEGPTECDICAVGKNLLSLPTTTCTPSPSPTPTPSPSPTPPENEPDCTTSGWFWNFQSPGCFPEPQTCGGHCVPYFPLEAGGCESAVDYCAFQWGCGFGFTDGGSGCCCGPTPILIDVLGDGFALTDAYTGVFFDMGGDRHSEPIAWTTPGSDDAWLVLDRNNNGMVDSAKEMFGNFTDQPHATGIRNGFEALAEFDRPENGGRNDRKIDRDDEVFEKLQLWQDSNHNGISEPTELHNLAFFGLATIDMNYKKSKKTDQYGNQFGFRAQVRDTNGAQLGKWAWDITLKVNPPPRP